MSATSTIQREPVHTAVRGASWGTNESNEDEVRAPLVSLDIFPRRKSSADVAPELSRLKLVADADEELDPSTIEREFPTISVERAEKSAGFELTIDDFAWRGAFDFRRFDEAIDHARPVGLIAVRGNDAVGVACEVLARYQRLLMRRNAASSTPLFDAVLDAHTSLFEPSRPPLRTEHEHALDTWQWMLRLDEAAGLAVQLAALLHDIDRLDCDPHERIEHRVHRAMDDDQAKRGGERALAVLRSVGVDEETSLRVRDLVAGQASAGPDAALLDDADALSFLSLSSSRYADYFGLAQTRRKVTFMLGRLGPCAREKVALFRLRPDVDRLLQSG